MSKLIFFMLPFDFMRVFWIITPFDLVAVIYLLYLATGKKLSDKLLLTFVILLFPIFSIISAGGIKNSFVADQHFILVMGLFVSAVKGFVVVDVVVREKKIDLHALAIGFLVLNFVSLALILQGYGFSGSGRAQGVLNQSNALGVFQSFVFSLALVIIFKYRILGALLLFSSILLSIASGSRGSFVTMGVVLMFYLFLMARLDKKSNIAVLFTVTFIAVLMTLGVNYFVEYFDRVGFAGASRVGDFLMTVFGHEGGFRQEFEEARGNLNLAAWDYFLLNPSIIGVGYGEALSVLDGGARPHNIIFLSLIELGFLGSFYFLIILAVSGYYSLRLALSSRSNIWLFLFYVCFCLAAFRTPFYFLAAMPWFVIIGSWYFGYIRKQAVI
ncbi:O-antigen ligase family protein [Halomonas alkalicola]|uniref:O-antigen ligase family protein n=1 Tax=Halomonas alkalicola TaxID=1930622 RepID=UPI0035E598D2